MSFRKKLFLLIIIATALRIIIAGSSELSNAEVYYWVYAQRLQLNYYDHPPAVAWLIRLTTLNLLLHNELFVRLGAIIASAACTCLIFVIGKMIHSPETGWFAALLYTCSLYSSLVAGTYILPDSPQMLFWLLSVLLLVKISKETVYNKKTGLYWCLFGIVSGLCIMSKIHGLFLWMGVVLFALTNQRYWFRQWGIYMAAALTTVIVSPIISWNLHNHFITFLAYGSRLAPARAALNPAAFFKSLLSVVAVANPFNFFITFNALFWIFSKKIFIAQKAILLILFCSLPLIIVLTILSLFKETMAHWPGPAYSCLLLLPALKLATDRRGKKQGIPATIKWGLAFILIIAFSELVGTHWYPGTISAQKEGLDLGTGDPTLDHYGWKEAGIKFDSLYKSDTTKKIMPAGAPIVVDKWFPAAHIDFYIAALTSQETIGLGSVQDLGHYYWMNNYKKPFKYGDSAYFIVPSNGFSYKAFEKVVNQFQRYELAKTVYLYRGDVLCRQIYVFRLKGYKKPVQ